MLYRAEKTDKERSSSNPMVDLFYGQFRAEGVHEGNVTTLDINCLMLLIFDSKSSR